MSGAAAEEVKTETKTVQCGNCLRADEELEDPRILPCKHVQCTKCITPFYDVNKKVRCFTCNEIFDVTLDSLAPAQPEKCDVCSKGDTEDMEERQPAIAYCHNCAKKYCDEHLKDHDAILEEHDKISIEDYRKKKLEIIDVQEASSSSSPNFVAPPKCLTFLKTVDLSGWCYSVVHYRGNTYVGRRKTVDRLDSSYKLHDSFITQESFFAKQVSGVTIHNERLYTFADHAPPASGCSVVIYDLSGKYIQQWSCTDRVYKLGCYLNKLVIMDNQVLIPNRLDQTLTVYSLTGERLKMFTCTQLGNSHVAMCAQGKESVIISDHEKEHVFRMNIITGKVDWTRHVSSPLGVACYGDRYVCVASKGSAEIHVLNAEEYGNVMPGLVVNDIGPEMWVYDLHVSGNKLVVPICAPGVKGSNKVSFYKLESGSP